MVRQETSQILDLDLSDGKSQSLGIRRLHHFLLRSGRMCHIGALSSPDFFLEPRFEGPIMRTQIAELK
jgi:hypothetical protein